MTTNKGSGCRLLRNRNSEERFFAPRKIRATYNTRSLSPSPVQVDACCVTSNPPRPTPRLRCALCHAWWDSHNFACRRQRQKGTQRMHEACTTCHICEVFISVRGGGSISHGTKHSVHRIQEPSYGRTIRPTNTSYCLKGITSQCRWFFEKPSKQVRTYLDRPISIQRSKPR